MNDGLNVIFMGTPEFSVPALAAIAASRHRVTVVYSQPPRPKGRGQQEQKSPVHVKADALGIPVFNPLSLKKDMQAQGNFIAHGADVAVVAAYGLILPRAVLDAPRFGCINIHASLLPRWRGASPIQRAIWAGDRESGITIMQMEEGLDTGPMILKQSVSMDDTATTPWLHDALSAMGGDMIVSVLDRLQEKGSVDKTPQDDALANYAAMLGKDDGRVNWTEDARVIDRQIRALNPWPGVWTMTDRETRLKIMAAEPVSGPGSIPGTVLDRDGHVACGENSALLLRTVQPENARPMPVSAAVNGGYLRPGMVLA